VKRVGKSSQAKGARPIHSYPVTAIRIASSRPHKMMKVKEESSLLSGPKGQTLPEAKGPYHPPFQYKHQPTQKVLMRLECMIMNLLQSILSAFIVRIVRTKDFFKTL
jgi:hypothetical protein